MQKYYNQPQRTLIKLQDRIFRNALRIFFQFRKGHLCYHFFCQFRLFLQLMFRAGHNFSPSNSRRSHSGEKTMCGPNAKLLPFSAHFAGKLAPSMHPPPLASAISSIFRPFPAMRQNLRNFYRTYGANKCPKRRNVAFLLYRILRILSTTPAEIRKIFRSVPHNVYTPPYFQEPASCGRTKKQREQTCTNVRSRRYVTFSDLTSAPDAAHAPKASAFFFSSECAAMSGTSPEHAHSFVL